MSETLKEARDTRERFHDSITHYFNSVSSDLKGNVAQEKMANKMTHFFNYLESAGLSEQ